MKEEKKIYNKKDIIENKLGFQNMMPDKWPLIKIGIDSIEIEGDIVTVNYDYIKSFTYKISEQKN